MLNQDSITFGKYKGCDLTRVLRDRSYCKWLLDQEWFMNNYEYLYNRVKEYNPREYFIKELPTEETDGIFLDTYEYFNLTSIEDVKLPLTENEKECYEFYLFMIKKLKEQIYNRLENEELNPFDIKAPTRWLKKFESETKLERSMFKEFLSAYELQNIPYIIERIKKEGGLVYKGAQSFNIAKERSENQEAWWEAILKEKYGEDVGTQYKYENCVFDMINISKNTIFECKLGLKDFNEDQHKKYKLVLNTYRIIYLIAKDCVIDIGEKKIYTSDIDKYEDYKFNIFKLKNPSYLDLLIVDFVVTYIKDLTTLFGVVVISKD
jgi:hypothetical protein